MKTNTLVILAAGASSRMKKSLDNTQDFKGKALIPIGKSNRPMIAHLLDHAEKASYEHIILVVGKDADAFKNYISSFSTQLTIDFAIQTIPEGREKPLGTADAVYQAMEQFQDLKTSAFVVCNSDNLYSVKALQLLREDLAPNAFISYDRDGLQFEQERILSFALVITDTNNYLSTIVEKPSEHDSNNYKDSLGVLSVSMNIWKLYGPDAFTPLRDCPLHPERNEKELPNSILNMVNAGVKVKAIPLKEHVPDLTSKRDIAVLESYLNRNK